MPRQFDHTPLPRLHEMLTQRFGASWPDLEEETLSLDLGVVFSELFLQKIRLLRTLLKEGGSPVDSDPLFLMHTSDIINNQVVVPEVISMPTSLEMAYTIYTLHNLPIGFEDTPTVQMVCEQVLKQDGYYEPVPPFTFVRSANFSMAGKGLVDDLKKKEDAIRAYIYLMEEGEK